MKPPSRERSRMLRHEGEKGLVDAIMIPDTLITILAAARAAQGLPWLLIGSQAASCWMESRATVEIEVLVPTPAEQALVEGRVGPLPEGHGVFVRTAEQAGVSVESVTLWSSRARKDDVEGTTVLVPQVADLFQIMLAERRAIQAGYAMYFAANVLQIHGPFDLVDVDLSPYQQERLAQAAALVIHHAADELERLREGLVAALDS
jgi:hypothetical protein